MNCEGEGAFKLLKYCNPMKSLFLTLIGSHSTDKSDRLAISHCSVLDRSIQLQKLEGSSVCRDECTTRCLDWRL